MRDDSKLKEARKKYYEYLRPRMQAALPNYGSYTDGDIGDFCGMTQAYSFHKITPIYSYTPLDL